MAKQLMIVAHPDDEVIFGGAHLIQEADWKVICVTNGSHRRRGPEFAAVMKELSIEYEHWSFRDTYSTHFDSKGLKEKLRDLFSEQSYERIVTHGLKGEYGHPQHVKIGKIVRELVDHDVYAFSLGKKILDSSIIKRKWELLNMYKSQTKTIKELCRDDHLDKFIEREQFVLVK